MDCRAYGYRMKEARVPTPCSPIPDRYPQGTSTPSGAHALGIGYSIVKTPMFTFTVSWHYISLCIYHALKNLNDELELWLLWLQLTERIYSARPNILRAPSHNLMHPFRNPIVPKVTATKGTPATY